MLQIATRISLLATLACLILTSPARSQFSVEAYESFLRAHHDIPPTTLLSMHPAGSFESEAGTALGASRYGSEVASHFELTEHEQGLVERHGFMVTERRSFESFAQAFLEIYEHDLPVFVSTDAILHAFHMSYDRILMDTEQSVLIPKLDALLTALHEALPALAERYDGLANMQASLRDLDVYLTVPRTLLAGTRIAPYFSENAAVIDELLGLIAEEGMASYPLFAETCRLLDFSQFTVRGHYTQEADLGRYFQTMMWLGRTEIYLIEPSTDECRPTSEDVRRQAIGALLLSEAADLGGGHDRLAEYDEIIRLFVGESDNVTLPHLQSLRELTGIAQASDLLDWDRLGAFQDVLADQEWAGQRILSQILVNEPLEPGRIRPASAFLLLGQRFVIDSYVTGSVVFDKIDHEGVAVTRMLPSTLDVLFALGNDAAAQLLAGELDTYHYADNLAALRHLVDAYDPEFWQQSLYNGWLASIRALNPPSESERSGLPAFMQTAAWWQQKMNTQLAAWAQLRHDNLLYAKQSYTGVPGCSYPFSLVEPIPGFYETMADLARTASGLFERLRGTEGLEVDAVQQFFGHFAAVNDTLAAVAHRELADESLAQPEMDFLKRMLFKEFAGCYEEVNGWYPRLFYGGVERSREPDMVVADIHTSPADESGNMVGWVLHVGTGPLNLAVVTTELSGEGSVTFAGPVMSYYEHLTTNFERLTDEAWQSAYEAALRPPFVNLYLADRNGGPRGQSTSLIVTSIDEPPVPATPNRLGPITTYPNPFNESAAISFTIPSTGAPQHVELAIYDVQGRRVRSLVSESLPPGNYTVRWDGRPDSGGLVASGTYFSRLQIGSRATTGSMTLIR